MNNEKIKVMNDLKRAFEKARECGYKVVVASDEEGNNWNEIESTRLYYGKTHPDYIAIGVEGIVDEEEVFDLF